MFRQEDLLELPNNFDSPTEKGPRDTFYPLVDPAYLRKDEERTHGKRGMRRYGQIVHLRKLSRAE